MEMNLKDRIGFIAGDIWHLLKEKGELTLSKVVENIDAPQSVVYMGVGWLAREDKLIFEKKTRGYSIRLKE
ncbi:MAG TPA: hypothetical protein ENF26_06450 [Methanomicrobia archaeon]|nr:hypothetical protein [Methanomicrobia archaeon]HEX59768.1 hypothetical protein [Methanomicrobia archaeon]